MVSGKNDLDSKISHSLVVPAKLRRLSHCRSGAYRAVVGVLYIGLGWGGDSSKCFWQIQLGGGRTLLALTSTDGGILVFNDIMSNY